VSKNISNDSINKWVSGFLLLFSVFSYMRIGGSGIVGAKYWYGAFLAIVWFIWLRKLYKAA
jgi:hypothetical protein